MRQRIKLLASGLALALLAVGCGGGDTESPESATDAGGETSTDQGGDDAAADGDGSASDTRPGLVTDIGGLGDRGFNDSAKEGMETAAEDLGLESQTIESQSPTDFENNLAALAEEGFAPVFGVGFSFQDAMLAASSDYPETEFAIIDAVVEADNVASLVFREEEGSFLAGVVAGEMTQVDTEFTSGDDKVVGFIGALPAPLIQKFEAGYTQGVLSVCPDCEVLVQYIGSTGEAFSDPAGAAEIARIQHSKGADIIYHAAGGSGDGLFDVAQEENFFAIGVNTDQAQFFPDSPILTSMLKDVAAVVEATVRAHAEGDFQAGVVSSGLEDGAIALASFGRFEDLVPDDVQAAVDEARESIIDGSITVETVPEGA